MSRHSPTASFRCPVVLPSSGRHHHCCSLRIRPPSAPRPRISCRSFVVASYLFICFTQTRSLCLVPASRPVDGRTARTHSNQPPASHMSCNAAQRLQPADLPLARPLGSRSRPRACRRVCCATESGTNRPCRAVTERSCANTGAGLVAALFAIGAASLYDTIEFVGGLAREQPLRRARVVQNDLPKVLAKSA